MTSRFHCASLGLDLAGLVRRHRRTLLLWGTAAACAHIASARWVSKEQAQQAPKPLSTRFVKREPRLTKPLELKRRPQPKRRSIQRTMVTVQARVSRQESSARVAGFGVMRSLAKPQGAIGRSMSSAGVAVAPEVVAQGVESTKETRQAVDMSLELVDIEALDTGQYHAMVVQDPSDKQNVRGFFHLAMAYSVNMHKDQYWSACQSRIRYGLVRLADTINRHTQIKADVRGTVEIDSQELLKTPWVWIYPVYSFVLSASEADNLGKYMLTGGFLLSDSPHHRVITSRATAADQLVKDALAAQGKTFGSDWTFVRLPNSHPVYHCFFDFPEGPPTAGDWQRRAHVDYLLGVFFEGRLVCIRSHKNFENAWSDQGSDGAPASGGAYAHLDPQRALQFGVNLVVYALTQEGSITNRVMDAVR